MSTACKREPDPKITDHLDVSPIVRIEIRNIYWYCYCVREYFKEEGHTSCEHLVLVHAPFARLKNWNQEVFRNSKLVPVRIHSECLFGDVFDSERCDCGTQLRYSLKYIGKCGLGVVIYLRQEGRGIGLYDKIRSLKVPNRDSFTRNQSLGLPADSRGYSLAARILVALGVRSARLITGNPAKIAALSGVGIEIVPISRTNKRNVSPEACDDVISKIRRGYNYQHAGQGKRHK